MIAPNIRIDRIPVINRAYKISSFRAKILVKGTFATKVQGGVFSFKRNGTNAKNEVKPSLSDFFSISNGLPFFRLFIISSMLSIF